MNGDSAHRAEALEFVIDSSSPSHDCHTARTGVLRKHGRKPMHTPNFLGVLSRGTIPHLTPDMMAQETGLTAVYAALEDFVEKSAHAVPPILQQPVEKGESRLRNFVALPEDSLVFLGARRAPPVSCPIANSNTSMTVLTSVGFQQLTLQEYASATMGLSPDAVVAMGDVPFGTTPGHRRIDKMTGRTETWVEELLDIIEREDDMTDQSRSIAVFVPVLPIDIELQSWYVDKLCDELQGRISGLAIYDTTTMPALPLKLLHLPRLCLTEPSSPHTVLRDVSLGADICTVPFIAAATDAGIALDFVFPAPSGAGEARPLGIDMWLPEHARALAPLSAACECYACKKHHRAYVQHLLSAKEMLAWVLVQVHNLQVMDAFFQGIRGSIKAGTFEQDVRDFGRVYEHDMPAKTGQGPRIRGYQFRSEGPSEAKRNPAAFRMLDDQAGKSIETPTSELDATAEDLERLGVAAATT